MNPYCFQKFVDCRASFALVPHLDGRLLHPERCQPVRLREALVDLQKARLQDAVCSKIFLPHETCIPRRQWDFPV